MSHLEKGRVWEYYLSNVDKTISSFAILNQTCEDTIKLMWLFDSFIWQNVKSQWGKGKLPNHQVFVSLFYRRNIAYLQSSHVLASIGFVAPSANLSRTVFESLLRGYFFIVEPKKADEYFQVIDTQKEETYNRANGVGFLRNRLYTPSMSQEHKEFYKALCDSSHANIKGTLADFPNYLPNRVNESLKAILLLMYGDIQMMAECFFGFLDPNTKEITRDALENIAFDVGFIPKFEPDKEPYLSTLQLKKGNFLKVL